MAWARLRSRSDSCPSTYVSRWRRVVTRPKQSSNSFRYRVKAGQILKIVSACMQAASFLEKGPQKESRPIT